MLRGLRDGAWAKSGAPLPYDAEVGWLGTDGSAWIDSSLFGTSHTRMVSKITPIAISGFGGVAGSRGSANANNLTFAYDTVGGNVFYSDFNNSSYSRYRATATVRLGLLHELETSRSIRRITVDGVTVKNEASCPDSLLTADTIKVGIVSSMLKQGMFRIHEFLIYNDEYLVCWFVPVRFTNENSETEGTFYDKVSGQLFRNQGTGAFVIGPDKTA